MTKTYEITKIEELVEVGKTLPHSWFRGHSEIYGELMPRIFRNGLNMRRPDREFILMDKFKKKSLPILEKLPNYDDHLSWLFLMQHYGLPTRLLDWTESPLIALFFAVNEGKTKSGELWAMNPDALNMQGNDIGLPSLDNPSLLYLAEEPVCNLIESNNKITPSISKNRKKILNKFRLSQAPHAPIAFHPPMNFPRMVSQLSVFTIHPDPKINTEAKTITELLTTETSLVRYIISAEYKEEMLRDLSSLGISRGTIFQDLDSLCNDVVESAKESETYNAWSLPQPPKCSGECNDLSV